MARQGGTWPRCHPSWAAVEVNDVTPTVIRLAPALLISHSDLDEMAARLGAALTGAERER